MSDTPAAAAEDAGDEQPQEEAGAADVEADAEAEAEVEGEAAEGEEETVEMDEAEVQQLLRDRISVIMANPTEELSIASISARLKDELGKDAVRQHKNFIRDFVKQEARRLQEEGAEAAQQQQAEGDEEGGNGAAAEEDGENEQEADADNEDENRQRRKKPKGKRLRRAADDDDGEAAGDEDYEESKSSTTKRRIPTKAAGRKLKDKSGAGGKRVGPLPPRSAYLLFSAATRPQLRTDHPDATFAELSKMIGELWKALDKAEMKQWKQQSDDDKERYRQEMEQLREQNPDKYEEALREGKAKSKKKAGRDSDGDDDRPKKKKKRAVSAPPHPQPVSIDQFSAYSRSSINISCRCSLSVCWLCVYQNDSGSDAEGGGDGEGDPPKELSWFDTMLNGMKNRRQTKSAYDEDDTKEMCKRFLARMDKAARLDEESMEAERPAVFKIKMLEEVQAQVGKKEVADRLIDHGLLKVVNRWLRPDPLPNIRLRTTLYKILDALPVTETDLETSGGLGRTVMQLWQHPDETGDNRKLLGLLIEKWMRPLLGLKTQYKHLADFEEEAATAIQRRSAQLTQRRQLPDFNTGRARIPEPANFDYAIRPQSLVERDMDDEEDERKERSKTDEEGRRVKMNKRLDKMNKGAAAAAGRAKYKVDVSGRLRT